MRSPRWDCRDSCYSSGALLDRFTHHVHILKMNGESYRLNLGFTQFKRRRQGNLQVGGTVRPGVPECRGQRLGFVQSSGIG